MAQYNIQFSSNASAITKQLSQLQANIARIGASRPDIKLNLEPLKRGLSQTKTAVADLNNEYQRLGQSVKTSFSAQNNAIASQGSAARGLTSEIGKLAAAYFTIQTAQRAFQAGIRRTESERRIAALSRAFGEVAETQEAAARAAQRFGLSQSEANAAFAQIYARLRPIGIELSDIESSFNGFNTAAKLSGASVQEASSAWLQLSQALGSGVLRGEELNSVFEQTPGVVQAIAKEMGVPIGQIRDLASEGEITSDIVIRALKRIETEGADQLAEAMKGPAQQVKNLQNEFENLQVAATKDLLPAVIDIVKELKNVLESLGPVIRGLGSLAAQTLGTVTDLVNAATKPGAYAAAVSIRAGRLPLGMTGAAELFKETSGTGGAGLEGLIEEAKELSRLRKQPYNEVLLNLMQNRLTRMDTPATPPRSTPSIASTPTPSPTESTKGRSSRQKRERESQVPLLQLELELARQLFEIDKRISNARLAGNSFLESGLELTRRLFELQFEMKKISFENIPIEEQNLKILALQIEQEKAMLQSRLQLQLSFQEERNKAQKALEESLFGYQEELQYQQRYQQLVSEGIAPSLARIRVDVEKTFSAHAKNLKTMIEQVETGAQLLEIDIARLEAVDSRTPMEEKQLADAKARLEAAREELRLRKAIQGTLPGAQMQAFESEERRAQIAPASVRFAEVYEEAQRKFAEVTDSVYVLTTAANSIGDSFGEAFKGVLTGASSIQEALAGAFRSIADSFADMVSQMISQWMRGQVIGLFQNLLPGLGAAAGGAVGGGFAPLSNAQATSFNFNPGAMTGALHGPSPAEALLLAALLPLPTEASLLAPRWAL